MLRLIISALFVATATAQTVEYRCDCGWFAQSQVDDFYAGNRQPSPLFGNFFNVDPYTCTLPAGGVNDCKTQCQDWADEILADGFNLCRRTPLEGNPRCWGGFMCENLNSEGFANVSGDSVSLWYRITDCPEDPGTFREWSSATRELNQALCCENGQYVNCYGTNCDCYRSDEGNFCECGAFCPEQFVVNGNTALPLLYTGNFTSDDTAFCDVWDVDGSECRQGCTLAATNYFFSFRMTNETVPDGPTYGQFYCSLLQSRIAFSVAINTELIGYQRAPDCTDTDGNPVNWFQTEATHPERLCCSGEGEHQYPCLDPLIIAALEEVSEN